MVMEESTERRQHGFGTNHDPTISRVNRTLLLYAPIPDPVFLDKVGGPHGNYLHVDREADLGAA